MHEKERGGEKTKQSVREGERDVVLLRLLSKTDVVLQLLASMVAVFVAWQLKGSKTSAADVSV